MPFCLRVRDTVVGTASVSRDSACLRPLRVLRKCTVLHKAGEALFARHSTLAVSAQQVAAQLTKFR